MALRPQSASAPWSGCFRFPLSCLGHSAQADPARPFDFDQCYRLVQRDRTGALVALEWSVIEPYLLLANAAEYVPPTPEVR